MTIDFYLFIFYAVINGCLTWIAVSLTCIYAVCPCEI